MKAARADPVVFDASVLVRAALSRSDSARTWTARLGRDVRAYAPDLIWVEVANALWLAVRAQAITAEHAGTLLTNLLGLPVDVHPTASLCRQALGAAVALHLTVYDASYLVLAEALDATLVTADRRLAGAASAAELIP